MFWKRQTDDEYVESVRKGMSTRKWIGIVHLLMAIIFAVLLAILLKLIFKLTPDATGEGFPIGFVVGVFAGIGLVKAGLYIGFALIWFIKPRGLRLLLEYHDRLQAGNCGNTPKSPSPSPSAKPPNTLPADP